MEHPRRKPTRLKDFDYSTDGAYFITICTQNRECVLSEILDSYEIRLSEYGKIAEEQIKLVQQRFTNVSIPQYVIMPNHIHLIIILNESGRAAKWAGGANTMFAHSPQTGAGRAAKWAGGASPSPTVSDVIRVLKSQTTRLCNCGGKLFQRSFHDHIIRNEKDYMMISEYIESNPYKWKEDCFYMATEHS